MNKLEIDDKNRDFDIECHVGVPIEYHDILVCLLSITTYSGVSIM